MLKLFFSDKACPISKRRAERADLFGVGLVQIPLPSSVILKALEPQGSVERWETTE